MTDRFKAPVIGLVEGCTHPESAELLADGETFVFGNCAMTMGLPWHREGNALVYLAGQSFVSRARLHPQGGVSVEKRELLSGLSATLGCDVLRRDAGGFSADTVFMATGGRPITVDGAAPVSNAAPEVLVFDPAAGEVLARIPVGDDSEIGRRFNGLDQPNGLALDRTGNLYVSDIPNSNPDPDPAAPPPVPPAVYRIPVESLHPLAERQPGAAVTVQRVVMPGYVNGVTVDPSDDSCWAVSCSLVDPVDGGIYHLTAEAFATGVQPPPFQRGLGVLDGVGVTRRRTVLASNPRSGEIFAFTADGQRLLVAADGVDIQSPADFNVVYPRLLDGEPALLVPDIRVASNAGEAFVAILDISTL